ncbi:hypothetical protein CcI156_12960 [Frankia sp. CcI156]|uniref:wax ester/triacylglycerol synthase domain-containing protein n=1 Tax=Frankia TaxID=1854 RepID=UPI00041024C7|nr:MULTISPECIES: wax ester/triacylglycerol synthase domain-containing protein [Frankia]EYT91933.1 hypothetical protein ThrDRAFT_02452 [Frankia casuarinae]OFB41325.1 hypothetical protein Manayef4_17355 [Frankia sp. CgIM4]OHV54343.1 hypothetical protein CgIS1_12380 [Frankia sp. CgIS1]ONH25605.1 hypothetical protein CcI156_12960 [Frankia sp. CcI156]ORT51540.1 hypothetical protein KBI5_11450 [Frankia sp. KB5]
MPATDAFFLEVEGPRSPQQVGGVAVLRLLPGSSSPTLADIRAHVARRLADIPPMLRRVVSPGPLSGYRWELARSIDLSWHVREVTRQPGAVRPDSLSASPAPARWAAVTTGMVRLGLDGAAPPFPWSGRSGPARRVRMVRLRLPEVRAVARAANARVTDVLLAMVAQAGPAAGRAGPAVRCGGPCHHADLSAHDRHRHRRRPG